MKTIEVKLYEFEELDEKAQAKVLSDHSDINVDYYWYTCVTEEWKDKLEEQGFTSPDIEFSGFYSQGDGASFTAGIDLAKYLAFHKLEGKYPTLANNPDAATFSIERISHRYSHENTVDVSSEAHYCDDYSADVLDGEINALEMYIITNARDDMKQIYKDLESDYDARTEESAIKEAIIANEYTFEADGTMRNVE